LNVTHSDKVAELEREISVRKRFYPQWQKAGRMKKEEGDRKIAVMEAILEDYRRKAPVVNRDQRSLFVEPSGPMVRNSDPSTSQETADLLRPKVGKIQMDVLRAIRKHGAMTARQAETMPVLKEYGYSTVGKRLSELHQMGLLFVTEVDRSDGAPKSKYDIDPEWSGYVDTLLTHGNPP
jgi:hypothetical protein